MLDFDGGTLVKFLIAIGTVLILILVLAWILKKVNAASMRIGRQGEEPRLSVQEAIQVDHRRRLVLLRRDHVEHLVLIGGDNDLLVEHHIPPLQPTQQAPAGQPRPAPGIRSQQAPMAMAPAAQTGRPVVQPTQPQAAPQPPLTRPGTPPTQPAQPPQTASQRSIATGLSLFGKDKQEKAEPAIQTVPTTAVTADRMPQPSLAPSPSAADTLNEKVDATTKANQAPPLSRSWESHTTAPTPQELEDLLRLSATSPTPREETVPEVRAGKKDHPNQPRYEQKPEENRSGQQNVATLEGMPDDTADMNTPSIGEAERFPPLQAGTKMAASDSNEEEKSLAKPDMPVVMVTPTAPEPTASANTDQRPTPDRNEPPAANDTEEMEKAEADGEMAQPTENQLETGEKPLRSSASYDDEINRLLSELSGDAKK